MTMTTTTTTAVRAPFRPRPGLTFLLGLALVAVIVSSTLRVATEASLDVMALARHGLAVVALYFLCIVVHDAVHGVLLPWRQASQLAGFLFAVVVGLPFALLQAAHLHHHQRVGHDDDPEAVVYGASPLQLFLRLPLIPFFYARSVRLLSPVGLVATAAHVGIIAGAGIVAVMTGATGIFVAWAAAALLAIGWFGLTTVYVPHGPARASLMPWLAWHSGWHDDHHRDPRFPFHQYAAVRSFHLRSDHAAGLATDPFVVIHALGAPLRSPKRALSTTTATAP